MSVLVLNAGSSSLKISLVGADDQIISRCDIDHWDGEDRMPELGDFLGRLPGAGHNGAGHNGAGHSGAGAGGGAVSAIGHRVVHGGTLFTAAAPPRCRTAAAWRPRWASRRWTGS